MQNQFWSLQSVSTAETLGKLWQGEKTESSSWLFFSSSRLKLLGQLQVLAPLTLEQKDRTQLETKKKPILLRGPCTIFSWTADQGGGKWSQSRIVLSFNLECDSLRLAQLEQSFPPPNHPHPQQMCSVTIQKLYGTFPLCVQCKVLCALTAEINACSQTIELLLYSTLFQATRS